MVLRHMVLSGESWIWTQCSPLQGASYLTLKVRQCTLVCSCQLLLANCSGGMVELTYSSYFFFQFWVKPLCWKCFPIFVYPFINEEVTGSWVFVQYSLKLSSLAYWVSVCLLASMSIVRVVHNLKTVCFECFMGNLKSFWFWKQKLLPWKPASELIKIFLECKPYY